MVLKEIQTKPDDLLIDFLQVLKENTANFGKYKLGSTFQQLICYKTPVNPYILDLTKFVYAHFLVIMALLMETLRTKFHKLQTTPLEVGDHLIGR